MLLHPHRDVEPVTVSDEAGETPAHFAGLRLGPDPGAGSDTKVWVAWWCTNTDNGFARSIGPQLDELKHLHDNVYGA